MRNKLDDDQINIIKKTFKEDFEEMKKERIDPGALDLHTHCVDELKFLHRVGLLDDKQMIDIEYELDKMYTETKKCFI